MARKNTLGAYQRQPHPGDPISRQELLSMVREGLIGFIAASIFMGAMVLLMLMFSGEAQAAEAKTWPPTWSLIAADVESDMEWVLDFNLSQKDCQDRLIDYPSSRNVQFFCELEPTINEFGEI